MLTFQYLVYVLEGDFLPRNRAYKGELFRFLLYALMYLYNLYSLTWSVFCFWCRKNELVPSKGVLPQQDFGTVHLSNYMVLDENMSHLSNYMVLDENMSSPDTQSDWCDLFYCDSLDVHPWPNTWVLYFLHFFVKVNTVNNKCQGSRRLPCKALIKDCISVMCMCHVRCGTADDLLLSENSSKDKLESCRSAATIALPEIEKCLCTAMQKLLLMVHL